MKLCFEKMPLKKCTSNFFHWYLHRKYKRSRHFLVQINNGNTPERRLVSLMLIWNRFHTLFRDLHGWVSTRNGWVFSKFLCKFSEKEFNHLNQMKWSQTSVPVKKLSRKEKALFKKKKKEIYLRWRITLWYTHCLYHTKTISVVKRGPVLFFNLSLALIFFKISSFSVIWFSRLSSFW